MNNKTAHKAENPHRQNVHFGHMLKFWRTHFEISQEELASRIDSASRHISRLEKGSAQPGKEMVLRIIDALALSNRDKINLLCSAGYTDLSAKFDIYNPDFKYRLEQIILGLKALDPNPTVVIDITGDMVTVNQAWAGFQSRLDPEGQLIGTSNIFDLIFNHSDKHSIPQEWGGTLAVLALSLEQSMHLSGDKDGKVSALIERLKASSFLPKDWARCAAERKPGQKFKVNVMVDGEIYGFLIHNYIQNLLGPLVFSAIPDMVVMTFCAEDERFDLSSLVSHGASHPLLFY